MQNKLTFLIKVYISDNLHYEKFQDGTVKCIEDEIPFEVPEGWSWCRLYMVGTTNIGLTYKPTEAKETGTIVLRSCNIKNGKMDFTDLVRVHADIRENQYIYENDILICARNGSRSLVGKCAIMQNLTEAASFGAFMAVFRSICNQYIYHYFNTSLFRNSFDNDDSKQINQVTQAILRDTLIPLPPFAEQNRIVAKLHEILSLVDFVNDGIDQIETIIANTKRRILDLAIRGKLVPQDPNDEPASILLERIIAEKEELIKAGKIKRDKKESVIFKGDDNSYYLTIGNSTVKCDGLPFELPIGWVWTSLGQYCEKVTDQVASGSFASLRENVVSLKEPDYAIMVKTADFANNFTKNLTYTDKHGYEFLENSNLFGGELILSNIGSVGKVFIVPDLNCKMTLAPNSVMIRLTNNEYRDYLYYFLQSPAGFAELKSISTGVAMLKFNKTELKTIYLPLPPFAEQKRIVEVIETVFAQLDEIIKSIA